MFKDDIVHKLLIVLCFLCFELHIQTSNIVVSTWFRQAGDKQATGVGSGHHHRSSSWPVALSVSSERAAAEAQRVASIWISASLGRAQCHGLQVASGLCRDVQGS